MLTEQVGGQVTTSYQHDAGGMLLSQTKHDTTGTGQDEDSFYEYNPHGDITGITDETGNARATYGYTAYGSNDKSLFTGVDKPDPGNPEDQEPYNAYRYAGKRFDHATGTYDMGFRDYDPGLNRFLTRDMFNGALADLNLGSNPWTMGRYTFAGGNPTSLIEYDGHMAVRDIDGGGSNMAVPDEPDPLTPDQAAQILFGQSYDELTQTSRHEGPLGRQLTVSALMQCVNEGLQDACETLETRLQAGKYDKVAEEIVLHIIGWTDAKSCVGGSASGCAWLHSFRQAG